MSKYWTRWAEREAPRPLTPKQKAAYMEDPLHCPYCGSDNIGNMGLNMGLNMETTAFTETKRFHCGGCDSMWIEDWELVGVGDLRRGTPSAKEYEKQWEKKAEVFNREILEDALMDAIFPVFTDMGAKRDDDFWDCELGGQYRTIEDLLVDLYLAIKDRNLKKEETAGEEFAKQWEKRARLTKKAEHMIDVDKFIVPFWVDKETVENQYDVDLSDEQWEDFRAKAVDNNYFTGDSQWETLGIIFNEWKEENDVDTRKKKQKKESDEFRKQYE